jgi:hypothetical protein
MRLNLVLLWAVAFLPFPTNLTAEALRLESDVPERTAVLFYGGTLLLISVLITAMTIYGARRRGLMKEGVQIEDLNRLGARTKPAPLFYVAILVLALLAPRAAVWMFLIVALTSVLVPDRPKRPRERSCSTPGWTRITRGSPCGAVQLGCANARARRRPNGVTSPHPAVVTVNIVAPGSNADLSASYTLVVPGRADLVADRERRRQQRSLSRSATPILELRAPTALPVGPSDMCRKNRARLNSDGQRV